MENWILSIRIAGNTSSPALAVIREKGYEINLAGMATDETLEDISYDWVAAKEGRRFSATTPEELLGLIAMWEVRGDDWRKTNTLEFKKEHEFMMDLWDKMTVTYWKDITNVNHGEEEE